MSWVDCMRLRRFAASVRAVGWINCLISIVLSLVHATEHWDVLIVGTLWATTGFGLAYGTAWLIDRHAEKIVGR
jgi:disulfide bond formation protein DsbB